MYCLYIIIINVFNNVVYLQKVVNPITITSYTVTAKLNLILTLGPFCCSYNDQHILLQLRTRCIG